jgi:hypothetical protein
VYAKAYGVSEAVEARGGNGPRDLARTDFGLAPISQCYHLPSLAVPGSSRESNVLGLWSTIVEGNMTDSRVSVIQLNHQVDPLLHPWPPYSRKAMVDDGLCDQRYWSLGRRVLQKIGLMDWESPLFKTKGSLQLGLEWAARRWYVSLRR